MLPSTPTTTFTPHLEQASVLDWRRPTPTRYHLGESSKGFEGLVDSQHPNPTVTLQESCQLERRNQCVFVPHPLFIYFLVLRHPPPITPLLFLSPPFKDESSKGTGTFSFVLLPIWWWESHWPIPPSSLFLFVFLSFSPLFFVICSKQRSYHVLTNSPACILPKQASTHLHLKVGSEAASPPPLSVVVLGKPCPTLPMDTKVHHASDVGVHLTMASYVGPQDLTYTQPAWGHRWLWKANRNQSDKRINNNNVDGKKFRRSFCRWEISLCRCPNKNTYKFLARSVHLPLPDGLLRFTLLFCLHHNLAVTEM